MFNRTCVSAMQLTQEATVKTVRSHYLCIFITPVEQTKNVKKTALTCYAFYFFPKPYASKGVLGACA